MHLPPSSPPEPTNRHPSSPSKRTLLLLLCVAQLMVILDISAVNVALPDIAKDLGIAGATSAGRSPATR